jgi:hypothetical protein
MRQLKEHTYNLNYRVVNKDKIFSLFDDSNPSQEQPIGSKNTLTSFNAGPYHKLGMFTKLILNHFVFHHKLEKFLQKEEPSYNVESTKEASAFVVFNRAYHYLSQVNPEEKEDIFAILDFNPKLLGKTLEQSIIYFEGLEEYEKCAHIHKFQKILKESKR